VSSGAASSASLRRVTRTSASEGSPQGDAQSQAICRAIELCARDLEAELMTSSPLSWVFNRFIGVPRSVGGTPDD
jgi:hypothetical protein